MSDAFAISTVMIDFDMLYSHFHLVQILPNFSLDFLKIWSMTYSEIC